MRSARITSNTFQRITSERFHWGKLALSAGLLFAVAAPAYAADQFMKPTAEELSMTSLPGYPGVPAVVLFREELTKDDLHVVQHYNRIKVLTEDGKKYANVELGFVSVSGGYESYGDDKSIGDIVGRTIHPDGTIIPFTGKPYLKTIEKMKDAKIQQRIFTLPDVTVGSIIEYRYATRINDNIYESPSWIIQGDLFVKSAHYMWYPTIREMVDEDGAVINAISWFPLLPEGVTINRKELPGAGLNGASQSYEVTLKDVPPQKKEEYMPPISSYSYRVLFAYTPYRTKLEYWKGRGKKWSKQQESFIGPNSSVKEATQSVIAGASTQDEKLRKIYAAVMAIENTDFTRERERQEDKAAGLGKISNSSDVLSHKRGNSAELTDLFVGMARAAGMKAYVMLVPDRSEHIFTPMWLNMGQQLDDMIAIVDVDGKEQYFDPGQRYCPYGQLAWWHTWTGGVRQVEGGTDFGKTPGPIYTDNQTARVANLTMDEHGELHGTIDLIYSGSPALRWRQTALKGDKESTERSLTESLQKMVPSGLEVVKVKEINGLQDYDKQLKVSFDVKGTIGAPTGKRLVMPVDLFLAGSSATFPHEKRDLPVYFHYPEAVQDALRINFPKNMSIEAVPVASQVSFSKTGAYHMTVTAAPTNVTVRRTFAFNDVLIAPGEYGELRKFYSQFETNDQGNIVLKTSPVESASVP